MRKYISIVEALNEATPVKPVQPVKPMKPSDPRHNAQNTTAPVQQGQPNQQNKQNRPQSAQTAQQQSDMMDPEMQDVGQDTFGHKLPNGQPDRVMRQQQMTGQPPLEEPMDGEPIDPNDPDAPAELAHDAAEIEADAEEMVGDEEGSEALTAARQAQQYLRKQGVIESAGMSTLAKLDWQINMNAQMGRSAEPLFGEQGGDYGSYHGRKFYSGLVNVQTGEVTDLFTYALFAHYDFDKERAIGQDCLDMIEQGEALFFYVDKDRIVFEDNSAGPLMLKLEAMIRRQLD